MRFSFDNLDEDCQAVMLALLCIALNNLNERERKILELRFGLADGKPHTCKEVGKLYHVTPGRILQIQAKAIRKMRRPMGYFSPNGYYESATA